MISRLIVLMSLVSLALASGCRTPRHEGTAHYDRSQSGYATVEEYDVYESPDTGHTSPPVPPVPPAPPAGNYDEDPENGPRFLRHDLHEPLSYFPSGVSPQNRVSEPPAAVGGRLVPPHSDTGDTPLWAKPAQLLKPLGRRIRASWESLKSRLGGKRAGSSALSNSSTVIKPARPRRAKPGSRRPLPVTRVVRDPQPSPFMMTGGEVGITAATAGVHDRSADSDRGRRTWDEEHGTQWDRQHERQFDESPPVGRPDLMPQPLTIPAPRLQTPPGGTS